ncbi:MAG: isopentenyl-diphosphate Delta-isomerase, partial [Acidimicrobiia bacterium]
MTNDHSTAMGVDPIGSREPAGAKVVLLDSLGRPAGDAAKEAAHQPPGELHNAFSVFVRDREGRHLLQRRASTKYHFAGRWANTCCGHPSPGERVSDAAHRRLAEEMGLGADLTHLGSFTYRALDPVSGLVEYECDQLFTGLLDDDPDPDPREVESWEWVGADELLSRIASEPTVFTPWLV